MPGAQALWDIREDEGDQNGGAWSLFSKRDHFD
jgi:hypothetical protein